MLKYCLGEILGMSSIICCLLLLNVYSMLLFDFVCYQMKITTTFSGLCGDRLGGDFAQYTVQQQQQSVYQATDHLSSYIIRQF